MVEPLPKRFIWVFAAGYFVFYMPYSGIVKMITSHGASGLEVFPATVAGTALGLLIQLTLLRWWRYARVVREPRRILSGIGTASQFGATTLAYTFGGVSIVLALLLMRGGVLTIAPVVDRIHGRRVRWFAWVAFALAITSVIYALLHVEDYSLPLLCAVNLGFYLAGYLIRLPTMTKLAKVKDQGVTRQYFVDEALVAGTTLVAVTVTAALLPLGTASAQLRHGFLHMTAPAFMAGLFYAGLHFFGTMIYLDWRENTFCIALNRCSSLLAGLAAAYVVSMTAGVAAVPRTQLVAAGAMLAALLFLSPAHHVVDLVLLPVLRRIGRAALAAADSAAARIAEWNAER